MVESINMNLNELTSFIPGALLIYKASQEKEILFANQGMLELYECDSMQEFQEHTGGLFRNTIYAEDLANLTAMKNNQKDLTDIQADYRIQTRNGKIRKVEGKGHLIHTESDGDVYFVTLEESENKAALAALERQEQQNRQVIEILASEYTSVYYIRMDNDGLVPYAMNRETETKFGNLFRSGIGYEEAFRMYAEENIAPEYREEMIHMASLSNLKRALRTKKTIEYTFLNTEQHYCIMRFVKSEDESQVPHIIGLGFADRDAEIRKEMQAVEESSRNQEIIGILASEYTSVYYISMDDNGLVPYTMNEQTENRFGHIFRSGIGYEEAFRMYAEENISISNRESMIVLGSLASLKMVLKDRKSVEYTYLNTDQHFCTMRFVKSENEHEEPHNIGLGFADRDAEMRSKLENEAEIRRNQEVIGILASEYTSVYYIRMAEDALVPYAMNRETESKFGSIFRSGIGYTEAFRLYAEENVDPRYREEMIRYGSLENLKKVLADRKTVEYTFQNSENHYCTMRFVKYEGEHETPFTIGLGFADRDAEIREQKEAAAKEQLNQDVINILASEYSNVYYINLDDDGLVPCVLDQSTQEQFGYLYDMKVGYTEAFLEYAKARMDEKDQAKMIETGSIENLRKMLRYQKTIEFTFLDPNVRFCTMRYVKSEAPDEEPHMIGLGFADRDEQIRNDLKQHEQLENALEDAEKASRAKTRFLANMSHDIRTPMNAVIGFAELAKRDISDTEQVKRYIDQIDTSGKQLLDIINNILEISKIENHRVVVEEEVTDTQKFYEALLTVFQTRAAEKDINLTVENGCKYRYLYIDRALKEEIMLNIVSNAVKYTPEHGDIYVGFREIPYDKPGQCMIRTIVKDNGIGMSREFQANLYKEFERERNSTVSGIQGTGLGLAIVKNLVELMDGTIHIDSELGVGTTVTIDIPHRIGEAPAELDPEVEEAKLTENLAGKRVLLTEDIDVNAMLATELLTMNGMLVERARNGMEGVDMVNRAETGYYDLILMDVQMPVMNGYDAARAIRSLEDPKKNNLPILAMTANAFKEDQDQAIAAGMNGHIAKPLEVDKMFAAISEVLR